MSNFNLKTEFLDKIDHGERLINDLNNYKIDGVVKLQRKIKQELTFLRKVYKTNTIKKEHLQCTNLTHYSALLNTLKTVTNCTNLSKVFTLNDRKLVVDIVCDGGLSWIKVVARNPKSLSQICAGETNYGVRSILDQAKEFIECSILYPTLFQKPQITFVFSNGVGERLANKLESLGIKVEGKRLILNEERIDFDSKSAISDLSTKNTSQINRINIDVSTMLAYVSSVTNGSCKNYDFNLIGHSVLAQQARWEIERPVKPILEAFFKGKRLFCCQTAKEDFINILKTVGGPNEKIRGFKFLEMITVLPDDATNDDIEANCGFNSVIQYSGETLLEIGGKIRERSLQIFSFGDRIRAVTVTSNDGFVRAAKQKGVNFVVFVHESRALTEQKETKDTLKKKMS
ncbi:UPF0415 protein C7orf25 homolog [Onthophagus taurus]|uniref:UPF0415 protein C7orf25 homolog n=1 Tax=Onthophagus taurus TaxID=166361 RepID=UPI000C201BB1|nr:UPF0415 protein C7orf25 homolog [Onthophagus taurus]